MARIAVLVAAIAIGVAVGFLTAGAGALLIPSIAAGLGAASGVNSIGDALLPSKIPSYPPLNNLQIMSSAPGTPISYGWGAYKVAGQVIWAEQIVEKTSQSQAGGKGGPTSNVYTYTVSCAISFGYGPGTILRIWADSKLVYDVTGKGPITIDTGLSNKNNTAITVPFIPTFYNGTSTQEPDPTIQGNEGINITPGFRDQIYMVLQNFPLADYGNRLPNFSAEISTGTTLAYIKDLFPPANIAGLYNDETEAPAACVVDSVNRVAYVFSSNNQVIQAIDLDSTEGTPADPWAPDTVYTIGNQVLDTNGNIQMALANFTSHNAGSPPVWHTGETVVTDHGSESWECLGPGPNVIPIVRQSTISLNLPAAVDEVINLPVAVGVDGKGKIWVVAISVADIVYLCRLNPLTFASEAIVEIPPSPSYFSVLGFSMITSANSGKNYIYALTQQLNGLLIVDADSAEIVNQGTWAGQGELANNVIPIVDPATGDAYVLCTSSGGAAPGFVNIVTSVTAGTALTATSFALPSSFGGGGTAIPTGGLWNASDSTLLITMTTGQVWKVDPATQTVVASTPTETVSSAEDGILMKGYNTQAPTDGFIKLADAQTNPGWVYIDCVTLDIQQDVPGANWLVAGNFGTISGFGYDPLTDSAFCTFINGAYTNLSTRLYFDRQQTSEASLGTILQDLWTQSGGSISFIDTSAVDAVEVQGYAINQVGNAKGFITPLCQAYFFDLVETDNVLRAIPRGQAPSVIIPEYDLGLEKDGYEINPTVTQENDLPLVVLLNYTDPALDYQQGKQMAKRNKSVKRTRNESNVSSPLTLSADTAAAIAARMLALTWAEKNTFEFNLWRASYLVVDPSDVIQYVYDGITFQNRINKINVGQDNTLQITSVSEDPREYEQTGQTGGSLGFKSGSILPTGPTTLFLLDIPYIQDTDNTGSNVGYYWLVAPTIPTQWSGAQLYDSLDGTVFNALAASTTGATYGSINGTPIPAPVALFCWDNVSTINVRVVNGTLASCTMLQALNGTNWFYAGGEILAFTGCVLNTDGSYTLSGLLRGLRGTEINVGSHVPSETFIMLNNAVENTEPSSSIGVLQYFRAPTLGQAYTSVASQQLTLAGNDLKPYAPAQFTGTVDGSSNINATWARRTRIGGAWLDGTGTVPLSEESEQYTLVIYNGSTVVRTVTGLTSPAYQYTAAEQTADFGSHQASVVAVVYQISAVVGQGFPTTNDTLGLGNIES